MFTINEQVKITAEAIGLIMRQLALTTEIAFNGVWSETGAGFETYGPKNLVWTTFVREHKDSEFWYKRVKHMVECRRKEGTL